MNNIHIAPDAIFLAQKCEEYVEQFDSNFLTSNRIDGNIQIQKAPLSSESRIMTPNTSYKSERHQNVKEIYGSNQDLQEHLPVQDVKRQVTNESIAQQNKKINLKWNKDTQYEIQLINGKYVMNRISKDMNGIITKLEIKQSRAVAHLDMTHNITSKNTIKMIQKYENSIMNADSARSVKLLGGGVCSGKPRKNGTQQIKSDEPKVPILAQESNKGEKAQQDKIIEDYTYSMNEEQLAKVKSILSKLRFQSPAEEINTRMVSAVFLEIYEIFSQVLARGITNTETQQIFQEILEGGVNFLLSLVYIADKQKGEIFDEKMKTRVLEKIKKTYKLFKQYETRLPLQVGIFLLKYQKKILQLKRKQMMDGSQQPKYFQFEQHVNDWNSKYVRFCFGGFQDVDANHLQNLINSLQIYYEFNKKQKFVVQLLKTEQTIITKYCEVLQKKVEFEHYFEALLKDYEEKEFCSIFYSYLMLFDQIFENCKGVEETEQSHPKYNDLIELSTHFIKLVTGDTFIELCKRTFYYENLQEQPTRKKFINSLSENYFLRYVELKILIQTYKLIKVLEFKIKMSDHFKMNELNNLNRLEMQIFEKFIQESSCEVNCLIYDDEQMLKLIESISSTIGDDYYIKLNKKLKDLKGVMEKLIINSISINQNEKVNQEKEDSMIQQLLGRKATFSLVMNDPQSAISNRFIEAFINRIASKKNDSLHEKASTIHVNQRLKFISNNALSKADINVGGLVEDSIQMLEKHFLAESNTTINVVAIKGGPGMGKTHLCRELMKRLMKQIQDTGSRNIAIPILVEMIEVENVAYHLDLESFLNSSIERFAFRGNREIQYLKNSTIPKVIILDGFSEQAWGSPSTSIRDWIRLREWQNTKLIITYRRPFVRAEEFPYFFGQKCKQPCDQKLLVEERLNQKNGNTKNDGAPNQLNINFLNPAAQVNTLNDDDRESCFEVFQILSLSQENVGDYIRQKEEQVRIDVRGNKRRGSLSLDSSMVSGIQKRERSMSIIRDIEPGFLVNTFRACTRLNTHLIDMLELPFNLFCFSEILCKVQGLKEIYWGGGGTKEERKEAATWFKNQEEMQEKLLIEEINGLIAETDIDEELRLLCQENCVEYFQLLAMDLFTQRKYKINLREVQGLITQQQRNILKGGGNKEETTSFERALTYIIQNVSRTSFLASSDISFFQFVTGAPDPEENENAHEIQSMKEFELNLNQQQKQGPQSLPASSQLYSFRNTPWLEYMIARAMKHDFDKSGNQLHNTPLNELQKFSINSRYLLEERSISEHNPFSISQLTNHASVEMNILKKLATIIRKDILHDDFQNKLNQKEISQQHRYIQIIQRTRRRPKKFYESKNPTQPAQKVHYLQETKVVSNVEEWVIKHQKHPLDIASSNILSAICYNKVSLGLVKLRNCSFTRAYLYGYRGELDIACSDVSEANLRGSSIIISRSKISHCLVDDEKNNHERWNSSYSYSFSALYFASNSKLICGSVNGGMTVFSPKASASNGSNHVNNNTKKKDSKKDKEELYNTLNVVDPAFQPTQFWQMTSYQRQFQEEVRAISTFKGDIYYAFLNIIAHVNENGEEKELVIGHQNKINDLSISEVHSTLATVSSDHTIRIWKIVAPEVNPKDKKNQKVQAKSVPKKPAVDAANGETESNKDEDVEESFAEMELLHTLNRHTAEVQCCEYSQNGLYLATGSYDETVFVWDIKSQYKTTISLSVKNDWITSLSFSYDSTMLVAGSSQSYIKVWDATKPDFPMLQQIITRKQRRDSMILGNTQNKNDCIGGISCVKISPNNKILIYSTFEEPGLQVYDLAKGTPKQYLPSTAKRIIYLDESVMGQDYTTRRMPYFLVNNFTFSPDGKFLAVSSQNYTLCSIWSIDTNFKPPKQAVRDGSSSNLLMTPTAFKINNVISPNKVAAMALTQDGRYIATCAGLASPHKDSCRITIWSMMRRGEQAIIMQTLDAGLHSQAVSNLCFSPDNSYLVSASEDDHFVVWKNTHSELDIHPLNGLSRQNSSRDSRRHSSVVAPLNTLRHASLSQSNLNQYMHLEAYKRVSAHKCPISSISFSADGKFLVTASAKEKSCKVWDGNTFDFSHQIQWEEEIAISKLEFSLDGKILATLPLPSVMTSTVTAIYQNKKGNRKISVQRKQSIIQTNNVQLQLLQQQSQNPQLHTAQQTNGASHQVTQRSSCCFLWNANDRFSYHGIVGTVKHKQGRAFQTQIVSMCFSKDSAFFVTGQTNGLCNVWDAQNHFYLLQSIDAHFNSITNITFSGDSQMLATTSLDSTCKLWHVPNRFHEISSFYVPVETSSIEFVRQGHSLAIASTSDEYYLKFVDIFAPNYRMEELRAHNQAVTQVTISKDGRFLLTASQDNTVRIWDLQNHFNQHYTINLNFRQQNNNENENQGNTLSKQEQKQDDNQIFSKKDLDAAEESDDNEENNQDKQTNGGGANRYKDFYLAPISKKKSSGGGLKYDILLSYEGENGEEDGIEEGVQQTGRDQQKLVSNINQGQQGGVKRNPKRKLSHFAAPNLKPSQVYQNKIKEIHKDENIDEQDYDSIGGIVTAAISEKGTFVFVVTKDEDRYVQMYDLTRGVDDVRESIILRDHTDSITALTLSSKDDYLATGCANTEIRIWKRTSLSSVTCEFELEKLIEGRHTKQISCLAFSPDMKYFASGSWDITCKVYDALNNFQLLHNLDGQYGYLLSLEFSPCSQKLAITSRDFSVYVWNVDNRLVEEELFDHRQAVTSCSYSTQYLATVSKDQSFILYDIQNNYKLARKIENLPAPVTNCCQSPDGKYLIVGLSNSLVQVWDIQNVYDLTQEVKNDFMYHDILQMENQLIGKVDLNLSIGDMSVCNFIDEEYIKENRRNSLPEDETASQHEEMLKQIPQMKKDCIGNVLKNNVPLYREFTNLQFDVTYTSNGHILVSVPKYPICVVTL